MVLIAVLAAAFAPPSPRTVPVGQGWADRSSAVLVGLGRDISSLQGALAGDFTATGPVLPPGAARALVGLQQDLRRARSLESPPGRPLRQIWSSCLGQAHQAVLALAGSSSGPDPRAVSAARSALEQAGEELVALSAAARSGAPPEAH